METVPAAVEPLWHSIAGPVNIPPPNRLVYFYPYANHAGVSRTSRFRILCRLVSVAELAYHLRSEQPVVEFVLQPEEGRMNEVVPAVPPMQAHPALAPPQPPINAVEGERVSFHVKVLTKTDLDVNKDFRLPVICTQEVFPAGVNPITLTDPIGREWLFTRKSRGNSQFLTGARVWKTHLNEMGVRKDDELVFKRVLNGSVFIGIRRKQMVWPNEAEHEAVGEFQRALHGHQFRVRCFPSPDRQVCVVDAELVDSSHITVGMTVRRRSQPEDGPRWVAQGTVVSIEEPAFAWKSCQVKWVKYGNLQVTEQVNIWDIVQI